MGWIVVTINKIPTYDTTATEVFDYNKIHWSFTKLTDLCFIGNRFLAGLCFILRHKSAGFDSVQRTNAAKIQGLANPTDLCFF